MTLDDLSTLAESVDLECKAAQGRNGLGELPEDFWKSYSAMANGDGGVIWLGIQEKPRGVFQAIGLVEIERVRKALWDNLHNRKQVSVCLLTDQQVQPVLVGGKVVLRVEVLRATRQNKPVHLGSNPFGGTYLRRHEGDYPADDEAVRRMLAERVEDSRDERVLKGFDFSDLDMETVAAYRNRFSAVKPGHVWADMSTPDFLDCIGATGKNRDEGYAGVRLAGLLMFGRAEVIRDALPHYMVDYQERPEAKTELRWIDRLVPDGSWSGNVYDFYRRVYQKLTADLKVPFQLKSGQRIDDTPVHEALREALVNTLIHADFSGRMSILVVKRPDMFGFRNPGTMRMPIAQAVAGGSSDCRNRRLQTMFQLVGYGDHAGSGLPKIYHNWAGQHWRRPILHEVSEPAQTLMELRMTSLLPEQAVAELEHHLGERFALLSPPELLALVTAVTEGVVHHARLREISTEHSTDISRMLAKLVKEGMLVSDGIGRGMVYFLPWQDRSAVAAFAEGGERLPYTTTELASTDAAAPVPAIKLMPPELSALTPELGPLTPELNVLTPDLSGLSPDPGNLPAGSIAKVISDLAQLSEADIAILRQTAAPVSERLRADPELVRQVVLALCDGRYLGLRVLADLLNRRDRDGRDLRTRILNPLVAQGALQRAYPKANDPRQAYIRRPATN
ncbi:MAG: RNA-binding domain-containing protein [Telluria sp.]